MSRPTLSELVKLRSRAEARNRFREWSSAKSLSLTGSAGWRGLGFSGPGLQIEEQTDQQLAALYAKSDLVFACVKELQSAVAEAVLTVGVADEENFKPAQNHDALSLFFENPLYGYADILELLVARAALTGASFAHLGHVHDRFGFGTYTPLPTGAVRLLSAGPRITGFEIKRRDRGIQVPPDEMAWHLRLHPGHYMRFVSPLAAAMKHYTLEVERLDLTADILRNRNMPPGFFAPREVNLTQKQRTQFSESYDAAYGLDSGQRGKIPMLPRGVDFVKGAEFTDIDFSALATMSETRICMVFGVPPILIGAKAGLDHGTYANYESARQSFYKETVSGWWSFIESGLTRAIFSAQSAESSAMEFRFDRSAIPELQADKLKEAQRASILFKNGIIPRAAAQKIAGVEVEKDTELAEAYYTPTTPASAPTDKPAKFDFQEFHTRVAAGEVWGGYEFVEKTPCLKFRSEGKASVPASHYRLDPAGALEAAGLKAELESEADRQRLDVIREVLRGKRPELTALHDERLAKALRVPLLRVYERAARDTLGRLAGKCAPGVSAKGEPRFDVEGTFNLAKPEIGARMESQLTDLAADINATTNNRISQAIKRAGELVGSGEALDRKAVINAVKNVFVEFKGSRVERIARTEWSRARHDSEIIAASETGIVRGLKTVVSEDACPICQVYDSAGRPTGVPQHPYQSMDDAVAGVGDYASKAPPFHPNCMCSQVEVFAWEEPPEPFADSRGERVQVARSFEEEGE